MFNLPDNLKELADYKNWIHSSPDKTPYRCDGKGRASSTNPDDWTDFNTASQSIPFGWSLGFVLTNTPFACIDLDTKKTTDESILNLHSQVYKAFNSCTEISASGEGGHIWIKGAIPNGIQWKPKKIEVYSSERYIKITGTMLNQEPIKEHQTLLDELLTFINTNREQSMSGRTYACGAVDGPQRDEDIDVIRKALQADNGHKFRSLWQGDTSQYNDDHSAADLALANIIAYHTDNLEQAGRLFRMSALGQRKKAEREDYLFDDNYGIITKAFDMKLPPVDLTGIYRQFQHGNSSAFSIDTIGSVFDYCNTDVEYIVEGIIPSSAITLITGDSGAGKSTFITKLANAIAHGKQFLGSNTKQRRVLYLDRENAGVIVKERLTRLNIRDGNPFTYWGSHVSNEVPQPYDPLVLQWAAQQTTKPIIFVDSLIAFLQENENDSEKVRAFFQKLNPLKAMGAAIVFLHHTGKGESTKLFRGSSDIKGAIDIGYVMKNAGSKYLTELTLTSFKERITVDDDISFTYVNGDFISNNAASLNESGHLDKLIRENPGITKNALTKLAAEKKISQSAVRTFINNGVANGILHLTKGAKNADCISMVDSNSHIQQQWPPNHPSSSP